MLKTELIAALQKVPYDCEVFLSYTYGKSERARAITTVSVGPNGVYIGEHQRFHLSYGDTVVFDLGSTQGEG